MKTIFLIEDDADDRELFEEAIEKTGKDARLLFAENGEEALEMIHSSQFTEPDYIFLDLNMPKMNGLQLLQELRKQALLPATQVFIYTTSSAGGDIDKCLALGGQLLTKHSSFRQLCDDLAKLIR